MLRIKIIKNYVYTMIILGFTSNCAKNDIQSTKKVTGIVHSGSELQTISNCWIYATTGWLESLHLSATGEKINLSESYLTYWDWFRKLKSPESSFFAGELNTGGVLEMSMGIISKYGLMPSSDFIPEEENLNSSKRTLIAWNYLNSMVQPGGRYEGGLDNGKKLTTSKIKKLLNEAFQVDDPPVDAAINFAKNFVVGMSPKGEATFATELYSPATNENKLWQAVTYPNASRIEDLSDATITKKRKDVLNRVLHALNDKYPVLMAVYVDFNAVNPNTAAFDLNYFRSLGIPSSREMQGGHLLVLADYTVENVPNIGALGKGEMSSELKSLAMLGDLKTVVAKSSWGNDRPERAVKDSLITFDISFLNEPNTYYFPPPNPSRVFSSLLGFYLPPGY